MGRIITLESMSVGMGSAADIDSRRIVDFGGRTNFIEPEFQKGIQRRVRPRDQTTYNWAGGVLGVSAGQTIQGVTGSWFVPACDIPANGPDGTYYFLQWVGIGGTASVNSPLIQVGVTSVLLKQGGQVYADTPSVWWEWLPDSQWVLNGLSVTQNTFMAVGIGIDSPYDVHINIWAGAQAASFAVHAPHDPAHMLLRESAEWIVERVQDAEGNFFGLPQFTPATFVNLGATANPSTPALSGQLNDMVNYNGNKIVGALAVGPGIECGWFASF